MNSRRKEMFSLLSEAAANSSGMRLWKRINLKYLIVFSLVIMVFVTAFSLSAHMRSQEELSQLGEERRQRVAGIIDRADQLQADKKYVAAKELYLSIEGLNGENNPEITERIADLNRKIDLQKEMRAYVDKIQFKNIRLQKNSGELRVTGDIINAGKRKLNDIELPIYCLNDQAIPVCEQNHTTISSDGKPLKLYQLRKFNVTIPNVPESAKEVQVVVSDIEFQGE